MSLTILQVAFPFAPVGPDAVGGAEQILYALEQALPRYGHRSITVAAAGSQTRGPLLGVPRPEGTITPAVQEAAYAAHAARISEAILHYDVDLVHMHGIDFHRYLPPATVPTLVTLHLPPSWYPSEIFERSRPNTWLHCVSQSQHRACSKAPMLLPPVENGVAVEDLHRPGARRRSFALVLGRICPEKNQHAALEAGTLARMPVLLGGQIFPYPTHEAYWRETIGPCLAGTSHRFLGPVGLTRKRRLLNAAQCLVSASIAPETSSLVAMEAMACGTPVIAFPSGALAELVDDGVTGFLVRNTAEMAEAMHAAAALCPERIRSIARRRFSRDVMVARYAGLYESLVRKGRAHAA